MQGPSFPALNHAGFDIVKGVNNLARVPNILLAPLDQNENALWPCWATSVGKEQSKDPTSMKNFTMLYLLDL